MFERDGRQKKVMENVTTLEVRGKDVKISTFFEEPRIIENARIEKIDFLGGAVILHDAGETSKP